MSDNRILVPEFEKPLSLRIRSLLHCLGAFETTS